MTLNNVFDNYRQHLSRMVKRSTTPIINGAYMPWRRKTSLVETCSLLTQANGFGFKKSWLIHHRM